MCVVSMVGDHYQTKWDKLKYQELPWTPGAVPVSPVGREEFNQLKEQVLEMKELLKRAKKYDEDNNEPNCEIADKMDFLRKIAALVGVSLDDVIAAK